MVSFPGLFLVVRVFGTSMVEEYDEIADSQYPSERVEYLDEDYGMMILYVHFVLNNQKSCSFSLRLHVLTLDSACVIS